MKKQLHILEGLIILTIIFVCGLLAIMFIYKVNHEKMDTSYMWNISFENLTVSDGSKKGDISINNNIIDLDVTLEKESEFYEFTLDINNRGTLSAKLNNINLEVVNPKDILNYKVTYADGEEIKEYDVLYSNDSKTIKVRIEYPKQKNKIYEALELKLSLSLEYIAIY